MLTYSAITKVKDRERAEGLGVALEKLNPPPMGVGVFGLEDGSGEWEVGAYFHDKPDEISILLLENAFGTDGFAISEIPETDWVAKVKRELNPVEAGRFFVFGKHDLKKLPKDRVGLRIEASMAFGTGHHGTTKGCLLALDKLVARGKKIDEVIDIGGMISISSLNHIIYGILIAAFLLLEPRGIAGIWMRVKTYFKTWPFSY